MVLRFQWARRKRQYLIMELGYLLRKVIDINKKLGGTLAYEQKPQEDEFTLNQNDIIKQFTQLRENIMERSTKKGAEAVKLDIQINKRLETLDRLLKKMRAQLADAKQSMKRSESNVVEQRTKIYENLMTQLKDLKSLLVDAKVTPGDRNFGKTSTDERAMPLLDDMEGTYRGQGTGAKRQELSEKGKDAMSRWKKNDEQMDVMIDGINEGLTQWKQKMALANQLIDQTTQKIGELTKEVDDTNDKLNESNLKLKGIIEKYRAPHKFCIDVALVIILIVLIVFIVKFAKK